ncbi:hypothetical protein BC828DRAFT_382307 [Blastocladiella britannica]|nr:hypothetical protein BC828DRAFT_382307 [Blastocladiella britannica]
MPDNNDSVVDHIGTGLLSAAVARLAAIHGPNLPPPLSRPPSLLRHFVGEVQEPMMALLLTVGVAYAFLGEPADAATVAVAVAAMVAIEIATERRAGRLVASLSAAPPHTNVAVRRDGAIAIVPAVDLVPGDIVVLSAGQTAPADLVVVSVLGSDPLLVNETPYTGEAEPVEKVASLHTTPEAVSSTVVSPCEVLTGSVVAQGDAECRVTATGPRTRLASLGGVRPAKQPKTALAVLMKSIAYGTTWAALVLVLATSLYGTLVLGRPWQDMVLYGLTLAFATIPEELPLLVKVILATTAHTLAEHHGILVRRLRALERLATVEAVVVDKTGTLTQSVPSLDGIILAGNGAHLVLLPSGNGAVGSPALPPAHLSSSFTSASSSAPPSLTPPPPQAILSAWAMSAIHPTDVYDAAVRRVWPSAMSSAESSVASLPVEAAATERGTRVRSVRRGDGCTYLRGAPEVLLARSLYVAQYSPDSSAPTLLPMTAPLGAKHHATWTQIATNSAARLLAIAETRPDGTTVLLGTLAFVDPLRRSAGACMRGLAAIPSIKRCVLATGDHRATAHAVAAALDAPFDSITARCSPEAKRALVESLARDATASGNRGAVMMIGDGANDVPAMRAAGIAAVVAASPGRADAALDAADLVLLESTTGQSKTDVMDDDVNKDGLSQLPVAIWHAQWAMARVRQAAVFYLACKVALAVLSGVALVVARELPFTPVQLLILEMSMDLGATLLFASERMPADPRTWTLPPSSSSLASSSTSLLDPAPFAVWTVGAGAVLGGSVLISFATGLSLLPDQGLVSRTDTARSMAFLTWMLGHIAMAYALRSPLAPSSVHGLVSKVTLAWIAVAGTLSFTLCSQQWAGLVTVPKDGLVVAGMCGMLPLLIDVVKEIMWSVQQSSSDLGRSSPLLPPLSSQPDERTALLPGSMA